MTNPRTHYDIACALVIVDGHIAMVRQVVNGVTFWSLPGGGCEKGESFIEAARRELTEETGLRALDAGQRVCSCSYDSDVDHSYCHVETFVFTAVDGTLSPDDPDKSIEAAAWVPVNEALARLRALPWPMMGMPAIAWIEATHKEDLHWTYAIDAAGNSRHLGTAARQGSTQPPAKPPQR